MCLLCSLEQTRESQGTDSTQLFSKRALSFVNKKCVAEADKEQSPVDWNQAKVLNIVIRDGVYDPDETHMKVGVPTILRIANNDSTERYFIDDDFFESVAVAQISVGDSNMTGPAFRG